MHELVIPIDIYDAMVAHCVRESPIEACGLLGGYPSFVSLIYPLKNESASETRYNADPQELIKAVVELRAAKKEILAIYHSHPRWPAIPSQTDLDQNHYGEVPRIIVSLLNDKPVVRIWRLEASGYHEIPWRITPRSV